MVFDLSFQQKERSNFLYGEMESITIVQEMPLHLPRFVRPDTP
jgi:hypothetical protein